LTGLIGTFVPSDSWIHFYCLNILHGLGLFGRLINGIYACGGIITTCLVMDFYRSEKKGRLTVISDLKETVLNDGSREEVKKLSIFMKLMSRLRKLVLVGITIPLTMFRLISSVITALEFESLAFFVIQIPVLLFMIFGHQIGMMFFGSIHLLIAHWAAYFIIRLERVNKMIDQIKSDPIRGNKDSSKHRFIWAMSILGNINHEITDVINTIERHNHFLKHFLNQALLIFCFAYALAFAIVAEKYPWYLKILPEASLGGQLVVLTFTFFNVSRIHSRIVKISQKIYICQVFSSQVDYFKNSTRSNISAKDTYQVIKTKFTILRLIHRISSTNVKIGFTIGDIESFTSLSMASFFSTTISTFIMIMNFNSDYNLDRY
jgi:hypothetical protein